MKQTQSTFQELKAHVVSTRGVSMVVALALLAIVGIVAFTSTLVLTNAVKSNTDFGSGIQSDAAAESAVNIGLLAMTDNPVGTNLGDNANPIDFCITANGMVTENTNDDCDGQLIQYYVQGTALPLDGTSRYLTPPPGTGDAGEHCENPENYDDGGGNATSDDNVLKPCNWNKLAFGEIAYIPLYIEDLSDTIDDNLNTFIIKVRTPCGGVGNHLYDVNDELAGSTESAWCVPDALGNMRPYLDNPTGNPGNDIIVNWQLHGNCDYEPGSNDDGACVGVPDMNPFGGSQIDIGKITNALWSGNYYAVYGSSDNVLDINSNGIFLNGMPNFLKEVTIPSFVVSGSSRFFREPVLSLSVVSPLYDDAIPANQIPYIEYQIETDTPITAHADIVKGRGIKNSFMTRLESLIPHEGADIEYVLQN